MAFKQRTTGLFIRGAPDTASEMTLHVGPSGTDDKTAPLTMAGQPGGVASLFITPNGTPNSGSPPLSINGGYGIGGGGSDWQGYGSLVAFGTSGISHTDTATLYINSTDINREDIQATLYVAVSPQPSASGVASLFVTATDTPAIGTSGASTVAPLYIRSNPLPNDNITLKIKTDFDTNATAPLYIANTVEDNNITTAIDGEGKETIVMNLTIKSPDSSNINLYTKGFLE